MSFIIVELPDEETPVRTALRKKLAPAEKVDQEGPAALFLPFLQFMHDGRMEQGKYIDWRAL